MPLKYANLCKVCQKHRTQDPSGICSRCRRLKFEKYCKICGTTKTTNESGVCYRCTREAISAESAKETLDKAIEDTKITLYILEGRRDNKTFAEIADGCGITRGGCYLKYMHACGKLRVNDTAIDSVDQTVIHLDEENNKN